ncbi:hypothetical protein MJO29_013492 [Puccinia striiformis f. sp. tritici]|nr:hypothetical protein MJO29_013492 [Puccinia striiformis f. sp. tritici]
MVSRSRTAFAMLSFLAGLVSANWDPSTGYLLNHRPTAAWLGKKKPSVSSSNIQASECSYNTRLQFPNVQAFAWFEVNHASDGAHGCPYGTCRAYTATPAPGDMEPLFTDAHSFFWHKTGGLPGIHTSGTIFFHPASPKNGAYGYEPSSTGKFIEGPPDFSTRQPGHDSKYPGFDPKKLQAWPPSAINNFKGPDQSVKHPKCGRPCEQNRDPGSSPGAYGGYQAAPASAYKPPKAWKPSKGDTCFANGNKPTSTDNPNSNNTGGLATGPKNHKEDSPKSAPQAGMKGKHSSPKAMRLRFRP